VGGSPPVSCLGRAAAPQPPAGGLGGGSPPNPGQTLGSCRMTGGNQENDWLGAPPGAAEIHSAPRTNNAQQNQERDRLGGPPGAAEIERAPRAQTHTAETRSTIGWEPPGAAHVHKAPRAQKHTQPKPGARLAGGPRGPPRSTGPRDRKNNIRSQEHDWPGAPPGAAQIHGAPRAQKTHSGS